jgi:FkbM family methyltransferase
MFSILTNRLRRPFLALGQQLSQMQQGLHKQLHQTREELHKQLHQTREEVHKQLHQTQEDLQKVQHVIRDRLLADLHDIDRQLHQWRAADQTRSDQMGQEIAALAADLRALHREMEHLHTTFRDTNQLLTTELAKRNTRELAIEEQLAAILARKHKSEQDRGSIYIEGLHAVGVLNYENATVSGERRFLSRFFEQFPEALVLDVGANKGQYSELVRELAPKAVVHAFEPHPVSFAALERIAVKIGIAVHPIALGDSNADIEIFDYSDEAGSQHASAYREVIEDIHRRPASAWKARCEALDYLADRLNLAKIGLLKIDTEGHELAVLRGAQHLLMSGAIDVIQFEFNEMNVISRVFMRDFFAALPNYRFYRLLSDGVMNFQDYDPTFMEVFAYQNMVCIRRDLESSWIHSNSSGGASDQ